MHVGLHFGSFGWPRAMTVESSHCNNATLEKDQDLLESTQKFACKLMTKTWDRGYDELLNMTNLPSLKVKHDPSIIHLI